MLSQNLRFLTLLQCKAHGVGKKNADTGILYFFCLYPVDSNLLLFEASSSRSLSLLASGPDEGILLSILLLQLFLDLTPYPPSPERQ